MAYVHRQGIEQADSQRLLEAIRLYPLDQRAKEAAAGVAAVRAEVSALALIDEALEEAPNSPHLHFWRAFTLLRQGDLLGAAAAHARMERLAPGWPETLLLKRLLEETSQ